MMYIYILVHKVYIAKKNDTLIQDDATVKNILIEWSEIEFQMVNPIAPKQMGVRYATQVQDLIIFLRH